MNRRGHIVGRYLPILIAVCVYFFYQLPTWNIFAGLLDEGYFTYAESLIGRGLVPYRDFFMTTMPGSYYVVAWLASVFGGQYMLAGRVLGMLSAVATLFVCHATFRFSKGWQLLYLACLSIFLAVPARTFSYNDAILLALLAMHITLTGVERKKALLVGVAGCVAALSILCKQSIGVLLVPALLLGITLTGGKRRMILSSILAFVGGLSAVLLPAALYYQFVGALDVLVYHTVYFAGQVKSHSSSFLLHRIAVVPVAVLALYYFWHTRIRTKLFLVTASALAAAGYIMSNPRRIGRFATYLPDSTFYVQTIGFLVPIVAFSLALGKGGPVARRVTFAALVYLVIFLGIGASGYSTGAVVAAVPVGLPLVLYGTMAVQRFSFSLQTIGALVLISFTALYAFNPLHLPEAMFGANPVSRYTATLPVDEARGIRFTPTAASELKSTIKIIQEQTQPHEQIFCFPYCPGLYVLANRQGGSYYSLFYFETFMAKDQNTVIKDLQQNHVRLIELQKTGELEPRDGLERDRLSTLYRYLITAYPKPVFENRNFVVRVKALHE